MALHHLPIDETLRVGVDLGEASCGLAALRVQEDGSGSVAFLGVRLFDSALTPDRTSKAAERRAARAQRRRHKVRRQRIAALRQALAAAGLPSDPGDLSRLLFQTPVRRPEGLADAQWARIRNARTWLWRAEGLDALLPPAAWAHVLLHLALHRGYEGKAKGERLTVPDEATAAAPADDESNPKDAQKTDARAKAKDEAGKVRAAARQTLGKIQEAGRRTFGEWMARDVLPGFGADAPTLRNRHGSYAQIATRDLLRAETRALFEAQRRLGNPAATAALEAAMEATFFQKPLRGVADLVGPCPFVPGAKRTARHAPSAEEAVAIQRLQRLQIVDAASGRARPLEAAQVATLLGLLREQATPPRQAKAQAALNLGPHETLFVPSRNAGAKAQGKGPRRGKTPAKAQAAEAKEKDLPILGNKDVFPGTRRMIKVLGAETYRRLAPSTRDRIAEIVAFSATGAEVARLLRPGGSSPGVPGLPKRLYRLLPEAFDSGKFDAFKEAAACSGQAMRAILTHLRAGLDLHHAERAAFPEVDRTLHKPGGLSPQATKATREALAQIDALCRHLGRRPGRIVVELARDLGRGPEQKEEIARMQRKREQERKENRQRLAGLVGRPEAALSSMDLRRYELWLAQEQRCIYTGDAIQRDEILDKALVHLDHIMPRSRGGDDEMANLVLCKASANAEKGDRTPYEWFGADAARWRAFRDRVENSQLKGIAKARLLRQGAMTDEEADAFRNRQLHDTMAASKALLAHLHDLWRDAPAERAPHGAGERRRAIATTGRLTSVLRRLWGLENRKYVPQRDSDGKPVLEKDGTPKRTEDPRHHAIDAAVVATLDTGLVQRLTMTFQAMERRGESGLPSGFEAPWASFRNDVLHQADFGGPFDLPDPDRPGETFRPILPSVQTSRRGRGKIHKDTLYSRPAHLRHLPGVYFDRRSLPETPVKAEGSGPKRRNALDAFLEAIAEARNILDVTPGTDAARPWDALVCDLERWRSEWKALDVLIEAAAQQDNAEEKASLLARQKALLPRRGGPDGPWIRAVRLPVKKSNPMAVRRSGDQEAYVEHDVGAIVRVDVHARPGKDGEDRFVFVPIYRAHLSDPAHAKMPPALAPVARKGPEHWEAVSRETFRFSLHRGDLILATMKNRAALLSAFQSFHITNAMPTLLPVLPHMPAVSAALKRDARRIARVRLTRLGLPEGRPTAGPEAWLWRGRIC
jgi:CRISPR-associated endonuclease Csn1